MKNPSLESDKDKWEIRRGGSFEVVELRWTDAGRNPDTILQDLRIANSPAVNRTLINELSTFGRWKVSSEIGEFLRIWYG